MLGKGSVNSTLESLGNYVNITNCHSKVDIMLLS